MTVGVNPRVSKPVPVEGRRVLVVGAGSSGLAVARLLVRLGGRVTVSDTKPLSAMAEQAAELDALGVTLVGEAMDLNGLETPDLAVVSPGVRPSAPMVLELMGRGVPVIGEMELAWQHCPARIAAITGTNGKGTTCRLAHSMLRRSGLDAVLAGNIGTPLAAVVDELAPEDLVILEVSSFQLMTTLTFAPHVAALVNVSPDHLDWHRDLDEYFGAKRRIFELQRPEDLGVVVVDDLGAASLLNAVHSQRVRVSQQGPGEVTWDGRAIHAALPGVDPVRIEAPELVAWGRYHRIDAMVATAVALALGARAEAIRHAVRDYEPPEHLMTEVAEIDGIRYVEDSKATNVAAALADLEHLAARGPVIVITGGKDKGVDLRQWAAALDRLARAVVLLGETASTLAELMVHPSVQRASSLDDALEAAVAWARPGDTVAFIPASSSFDMFDSYADRGNRFQETVRKSARRAQETS